MNFDPAQKGGCWKWALCPSVVQDIALSITQLMGAFFSYLYAEKKMLHMLTYLTLEI